MATRIARYGTTIRLPNITLARDSTQAGCVSLLAAWLPGASFCADKNCFSLPRLPPLTFSESFQPLSYFRAVTIRIRRNSDFSI